MDALTSEEFLKAVRAICDYTKFCVVESFRPSTQYGFYKQVWKMGLRATIREGTLGSLAAMGDSDEKGKV